MAEWTHKLDISAPWKEAAAGEIDARTLARRIADIIEAHSLYGTDETLTDIAHEFEGIAEDETATFDDTDEVMSNLYDWGDTSLGGRKKLCWIKTAF